MKAIVVRQPWATLIALGVKQIETRPFPPNGPMRPEGVRGLPGCSLERSQRIAIVAGAQRPAPGWIGGQYDWCVGEQTPPYPKHAIDVETGECPCPDPDDGAWSAECRALNDWTPALLHDEGAHGMSVRASLPLGAVVCTVTVDDALPIVAGFPAPDLPWAEPRQEAIAVYRTEMDRISYHPDDDEAPGWQRHFYGRGRCYPLDDQLPLDDFTPGRWGYLLSDPRPCDPIPCKGRQGVFELPAEIAEALS